MTSALRNIVVFVSALLVASACGGDDASDSAAAPPSVVVTTGVLANVVENLVGDQASVVAVIPAGASPHDFQASARDVDRIRRADALVANGAGLEEGLEDVLDAAADDGVPTFEAIDVVEALSSDDADVDHDHGTDPHFVTDPLRMAEAATGIAEFLASTVDGIDADQLDAATAAYVRQLEELHEEVVELLVDVPVDARVLVTNHDVLSYFADRYGFEVLGAVVPGGSTTGAASAATLAALAEIIRAEDAPAVFTDSSSSDELAETLAEEAGDVVVVELFTESLGGPGSGAETYLEMVRTDAMRIADALS